MDHSVAKNELARRSEFWSGVNGTFPFVVGHPIKARPLNLAAPLLNLTTHPTLRAIYNRAI